MSQRPFLTAVRTMLCRFFFLLFACLSAASAWGQQAGSAPDTTTTEPSEAGRPAPAMPVTAASATAAHGELVLALPFENKGASGSLDWIGAAFPDIMNRRFASAGFLPISRKDRLYALEHLGLPPDFRPTRASTLRLAQTLDADAVIFGTYQVTGTRLTATAQMLDITNLRETAPMTESAELSRLPDVINALAWRVTRQLDPTYTVAEQTFLAADAHLRLDAFEDYIRGLVQGTPEDRTKRLDDAVRLDPSYDPAWLALGDAEFAAQNYEAAAAAYGHLTRNDPDALQADFYRGLAYFYAGKYLQAEDAWAFVSTRLPLPEVVNNQGVAAARRGKNGTPQFQQAITGDPKDADYHWNLALAYARQSDLVNAEKETAEAEKLRPGDSEITAFADKLKQPGYLPQAGAAGGESTLPLERIKRSYNEAAFRQAAFELEQMQALRAATESPAKRLAALLAGGERYLRAGLVVESEREFNRALAENPGSAEAYAGLARIRERTADRDKARQLAAKSLGLKDNAEAHLVLARLAIAAGKLPEAQSEVAAALRVDAENTEARALQQSLVSRTGQAQ